MIATKGTVKWFNNSKGYGFIQSEDGIEIFVHFSDIQIDGFKTLLENQFVEFLVGSSDKGPIAKKVTPQIRSNLTH